MVSVTDGASVVTVSISEPVEEVLRGTSDPGDTKELAGPLEDRVRVIVAVSRPVLVVVMVNVLVDAGWSEPVSVLLAKELMEPGSTPLVLTGAEDELGCVESEAIGADNEAAGADDEAAGSDDEEAGSDDEAVGGAGSEVAGADNAEVG